jgi:hypothetical protein
VHSTGFRSPVQRPTRSWFRQTNSEWMAASGSKAGAARLAEGGSADAPSVLAGALGSVLASVLASDPDRIPVRGGKRVHRAAFRSP